MSLSWTQKSNLTGPKGKTGDTGPKGNTGNKGDTGPKGATGERGSKWFTGTGTPSSISGAKEGDYYLDTNTGKVYEYTG